MKLQIKPGTKFSDLQSKFSEMHPFLKVEFYKEKYSENEVSTKDRMDADKVISEQSKSFKPESLDIDKARTVAEVEKEFYDKYGISMQVSRKSGSMWIETSKTDDRTLEAQNDLGKTMSTDAVDIMADDELDTE